MLCERSEQRTCVRDSVEETVLILVSFIMSNAGEDCKIATNADGSGVRYPPFFRSGDVEQLTPSFPGPTSLGLQLRDTLKNNGMPPMNNHQVLRLRKWTWVVHGQGRFIALKEFYGKNKAAKEKLLSELASVGWCPEVAECTVTVE